MPVWVAGEVDLCGSLVDLMTGISIRVVQDELVSHITQQLVCNSCHRTTHMSDQYEDNDSTETWAGFCGCVPPIFCLSPSTWQEETESPLVPWEQISLFSPEQTDRW